MRPVNLIPPEERRGGRAPSRTGGLAYVIIGVLAVALLAVVGVVLTDNQVADRQAQVADLTAQLQQTTSEANRLQSYADFASMKNARFETVSNLAKSRFDWYRVLRELGFVIPNDVWLTDLQGAVSAQAAQTASVSSSGSGGGGATADVSAQITGPSLTIQGCAASHDAVASFMGALRDIDGVTRVGVTSSRRVSSPTTGGTGSSSTACAVRNFITQFEVVVAFDKVQIDPTTGLVPTTAPTLTTATTQTAAPTDVPASGSDGVASAVKQESKGNNSANQQSAKAHQAVSTLIPGTVHP
jgi:Tfp pilus assembly protein PilN